MKGEKNKRKWVRFRHRLIRNIAYIVLYPYLKAKYRVRVERFKEQKKRQYLILFNHQTALDQFIVGSAFKGAVYYVASEDLFSNGWISRLLEWAVAPIPIKKQATDARAVMNCLRVRKEGGTIAIAPEGNRTFSGKTEYIKPAIVGLVKALKMPLALFRIEGGYGVHPRWSDTVRKGKMRAYVSRVVEPEEYLALSDEALFDLIVRELSVNDCLAGGEFHGKKRAEYLERAYYVCPSCGLTTFETHGDTIVCKKCERKVRYLPTHELRGEEFDFPFRNTAEWYDHQSDFVNGLDLAAFGKNALFSDTVCLYEVTLYKNKRLIAENARASLNADGIAVETEKGRLEFPFGMVSTVTVLGRNKLNIYHDGKLYQLKGDSRFNAVKYVQLCYRAKNILKGENDGKFLGL